MDSSKNDLSPEPLATGKFSPRYPAFTALSSRLSSYKLWPEYLHQQPEYLAEAGFFYEGSNGKVCCFCCGAKIKGWEPEDDPYVEHARWYPKCTYLKQQKGEQFIKDVQSGRIIVPTIDTNQTVRVTRKTTETSATVNTVQADTSVLKNVVDAESEIHQVPRRNENEHMSTGKLVGVLQEIERPDHSQMNTRSKVGEINDIYDKLKEERKILKDRKKCKICWDEDATVVFRPCGHLASCIFCSPSFHKCPICRANIKDTMEAILI